MNWADVEKAAPWFSMVVSIVGWFITGAISTIGSRQTAAEERRLARISDAEALIFQILDKATEHFLLPGSDPLAVNRQQQLQASFARLNTIIKDIYSGKTVPIQVSKDWGEYWEACTGNDATDQDRPASGQRDPRFRHLRDCAQALADSVKVHE